MIHHAFRATTWTIALTAISAFVLTEPPADGERALLGRTPARELGTSNLRMARPEGPVSAVRALLGKLTASEEQGVAGEAIQIRPRRVNGPGALLGRP
jgi:hypothetical protein